MCFGKLLKQYRLSYNGQKHSQEALGMVIETSRQYIDALEKNKPGARPPKFSHCQKLAQALGLSEEDKYHFFWTAFQERIHANMDFYSFLHAKAQSKSSSLEQVQDTPTPDKKALPCSYKLIWKTSYPEVLEGLIAPFLEDTIREICTDAGYQTSAIQVGDLQLSFCLSTGPDVNVLEFCKGLQELCSRSIKSHFDYFHVSSHSIWDHDIEIYTLAAEPSQSDLSPYNTTTVSSLEKYSK